MKTQFGAQLIT